jgi:lipoprotein-anchoring transpeptidase ErfK/SrfK
MSAHRKETPRRVRPRVRRIAAASVSTAITSVALLGAAGVIPLGGAGSAATRDLAEQVVGVGAPQDPGSTAHLTSGSAPNHSSSSSAKTSSGSKAAKGSTKKTSSKAAENATALPASSGTGRRVVFSKSAQRVWLVDAQGTRLSTYLVSGSVTDNLPPGEYHVYSRSRWAVGVDDSGVMQFFVRFAHGANAAIGFHSIPSKLGHPLQTLSELGTPQSHGCIRQKLTDAEQMWAFAKTGTPVVVLA